MKCTATPPPPPPPPPPPFDHGVEAEAFGDERSLELGTAHGARARSRGQGRGAHGQARQVRRRAFPSSAPHSFDRHYQSVEEQPKPFSDSLRAHFFFFFTFICSSEKGHFFSLCVCVWHRTPGLRGSRHASRSRSAANSRKKTTSASVAMLMRRTLRSRCLALALAEAAASEAAEASAMRVARWFMIGVGVCTAKKKQQLRRDSLMIDECVRQHWWREMWSALFPRPKPTSCLCLIGLFLRNFCRPTVRSTVRSEKKQ